jgi:PAS domain S-box-containing protein
MTNNNCVLIVDDDPNLLRSLSDILGLQDFEVLTASDGKSAIRKAEVDSIEVALIDLNLTDMPGLDVLSEIKRVSPDTECMLLTGYASQETAIEAVNRGAFAYFQKPYDIDALILAIHRAIEKRQSKIALAISEARHQMVAELTSDYVYEMNVDENEHFSRSWISESFARITGYTPVEMDARGGWKKLIYQEDEGAYERQVDHLLSNQSDFSEYRIVRKDGEVRWIEDYSRPILDKTLGRVVKIIGAARDITEKKQAQAETLAQTEKLESIYRTAPIGIGITANRIIIEANETFCRLTGYSKEEIIGQSTRIFYASDEEYEWVGEKRKEPKGLGKLFEIETHFKRKDGEIIDVLIRSSPLIENDESKGRTSTILDITQQKKAVRALQESEEKFSLVFRNSPFAILVTDHETGQIVDVNPAFTEISGYERDEVIHQTTVDLHVWKDLGDRDLVLDLLNRGHRVIGQEYAFVRKDGGVIYGLYSADFIQLKGKTYILSSIDDITERKQRELELQVVANMSEAIRNSKSLEDLKGILVKSLIQELDLDGVTLEQISPLDDKRKRVYCEGVWKGLEGQTIPVGKGIGGEVIASRSARLISDAANDKNLFHRKHFKGLKSAACIPLIIQDEVTGLFWVGSRRELGEMDLRLMTSIADMAANAIHRETLHEETLHLVDRLKLQADAMNAAASAIVILDENFNVEWANPAFETLTGFAFEEARGKRLKYLLDSGMVDQNASQESEKTVLRGEVWSGRVVNKRKDGSLYIDELTVTPIKNGDGKVTKYIEIKQDVTERVQHDREILTMAKIGTALRSTNSRQEVMQSLLEELMNHFEVDGAVIEILDPLSGELTIESGTGVWAEVVGKKIPPGMGMSAEVLKTGKLYLNNQAFEDERLMYPETFGDCKSAAGVPMFYESEIVGLIWVGSRRELSEDDIHVLQAIADMAANAIHRAELHEETLRRLEELNTLRSIDQAINSSTDLHLTLDLIVKQLKNLSGADAVDILIYHPALMMLRYAAGEGFQTEEIRKSTMRIGEGGAGRVALEQQPLWISDMRQAEGECVRKELLMAEGFTAYHAFPLVVKGEIKGVLEVFHRAPFSANDEWKRTLETVATQTAIAIDNSEMFDGMKRLNTELILAYDETIEGWAAALELRDHDTEGHSRRVTEHTLTMARAAGMSPDELTHVRRGALLHDIGKIGVPDNILQKPGPLDDNEWIVMREHPKISYQLLSKVMYLKPALDIPYCHHEHWDGSGYPRGLKEEEIPLAARLFTVADVYDALISDRPYRKAWTKAQALKYMKEQAGKQFDPQAVKFFLDTLDYFSG